MPHTVDETLEAYLLTNDLQPTTEAWYRRIFGVFREWCGRPLPMAELTHELLSEFLRAKRDGHSSYYCKSLRNGLLAVLGEHVDRRKVRRIKLTALRPGSWSQDDLLAIVSSCVELPEYKQVYYKRISQFGWHTGLSRNDLHLITAADFSGDGTLIYERHKTGEHVVAWVPLELFEGLPQAGPLFPRRWSDEQFRKDFKRIVTASGLTGTFKKLRKTSGTQAELLTGRGHEHLANSRRVFESHYLDRRIVHREPVKLPKIG